MNRLSFAAGAVTALAVSAATWGALHSIPAAKAAADGTLGKAVMAAVVQSDGALARGTGVVSTVRETLGHYLITFERSVADCANFATVGHWQQGGSSQKTIIAANPVTGNLSAVRVQTELHDGNPVDNAFHLQVFCWR